MAAVLGDVLYWLAAPRSLLQGPAGKTRPRPLTQSTSGLGRLLTQRGALGEPVLGSRCQPVLLARMSQCLAISGHARPRQRHSSGDSCASKRKGAGIMSRSNQGVKMRKVACCFAVLAYLYSPSVPAQTATDLHCKLDHELSVLPSNLSAKNTRTTKTHRISGDSVFINDPSRPAGEYLYGKLIASEPGNTRYAVGHKTYIFDDPTRSRGMVVHVSADEVRIAKLTCR